MSKESEIKLYRRKPMSVQAVRIEDGEECYQKLIKLFGRKNVENLHVEYPEFGAAYKIIGKTIVNGRDDEELYLYRGSYAVLYEDGVIGTIYASVFEDEYEEVINKRKEKKDV